jgi:prepilin-type N-terminal cleavage/methylation domain-containing protein
MQRKSTTSGFTLVELMVTIAIVAVLSSLALVGYQQWIYAAKTAEATSMIASIQNGQETYFADMQQYLNVSGAGATLNTGAACTFNAAYYYPASAPTGSKAAWVTTGCAAAPVCANFNALNFSADAAVYYRYASIAGPTVGAPNLGGDTTASTGPWYEVEAVGDLNSNGTYGCYFASSMLKARIWSFNPNE